MSSGWSAAARPGQRRRDDAASPGAYAATVTLEGPAADRLGGFTMTARPDPKPPNGLAAPSVRTPIAADVG